MPERSRDPAALVAQAAAMGIGIDQRQARTMLDFRDLLMRWNAAFNLVSRRDTGRFVARHLLDSLSVLPWLTGKRVLDLGTGAGLPGVPLAIAREETHFTLIDLSERRIRFVRQAVRALGLTNVAARCGDVRSLDPDVTFDTVVSRAVVGAAPAWALASTRVRRPQGRMVIMSRAQGCGDRAAPDLPADVCVEALQRVPIPGLAQPHELIVLRHHDDARAGSAR